MLSRETLESARTWYESAVQRFKSDAQGLALNYLERAIPVFAEAKELRLLTHARHYQMLALQQEERFDDAERLFADIMQGYSAMGDSYGQSLLLAHLAGAQAVQGRWERAHSLFNLACVVAENDQQREVVVHVLWQHGLLCRQRDNLTQAITLFQRAERLVQKDEPPRQLPRLRFLRAQTLSQLGEAGEAIALLEDVQTHLVRSEQHQEAMEPLSLLRDLYEEEGQEDERARIGRLMHLAGQRMIQADSLPRSVEHLGPPVDPAA